MDFFPEMDSELKSSFPKQSQFTSNLESASLLPESGLKARNLLNPAQMQKLKEIRERHLRKPSQRTHFLWD